MTDKNSHYKIDFKIKMKDNSNLTLSSFTNRRYWSSEAMNHPAINIIVEKYLDEGKWKELMSYSLPEDRENVNFPDDKASKAEIANAEKIGFPEWSKLADMQNSPVYDKIGFYEANRIAIGFKRLQEFAAKRTPEYKEYEAKFAKWLKRRPALVKIWQEVFSEEISLDRFAATYRDNKFRSKLETSRPKSFCEGTLVKLRSQYVNKRNRDPFYWLTPEVKSQDRIGMVAKFQDSYYAYGLGSREIKIMWLASGEESAVPERCLEILEQK